MLIGRTESLYLQHQGRLPRGSPEQMIKKPGRGYTYEDQQTESQWPLKKLQNPGVINQGNPS